MIESAEPPNVSSVRRPLTTVQQMGVARLMADSTITLCACGCGQPAPIAKSNHTKKGAIKGQPQRYVHGHWRRGRTRPDIHTYREIYRDGQRIRVHRIRAEKALGYPLPPNAVIHHPDRDIWNPNARLVICESQAYHRLLHARERLVKAGGNPNTDAICRLCRLVKPRTEFYLKRSASFGVCDTCRVCASALDKQRRLQAKGHIA